MPRPWPENVELGQSAAEKLIRRDRRDSWQCSQASLAFARHTEKRDTALSPKKKSRRGLFLGGVF